MVLAVLFVAGACGGDDEPAAPASEDQGPRLVVASFGFVESEILATIYGKALEAGGIDVTYRLRLGTREVVGPALEKGEVDLVPEYAGNLLVFLDPAASEPGDDLDATIAKLRPRAASRGVTLLEPSQAANGDVLAMSRSKAAALHVISVSDLAGKSEDLVLGGPPECPQRTTCLKGLQEVYGLRFADFRALDTAGPITVRSLIDGEVDVARLFSSDPAIFANDFVVLQDDKGIQPVGNVVPVIRTAVRTDQIASIVNGVSSKLTGEDLVEFNRRVEVEGESPAAVASGWLRESGMGEAAGVAG